MAFLLLSPIFTLSAHGANRATWAEETVCPENLSSLSSVVSIDQALYIIQADCMDVYHVTEKKWSKHAVPFDSEAGNYSCVVNNKIYIFIWETDLKSFAVHIYDPIRDIWMRGASSPAMAKNKTAGYAEAIGSNIYLIGGSTNDTWIFNTANDAWTRASNSPHTLRNGSCVVYHGDIYVFGGLQNGGEFYRNYITVYHPNIDAWDATYTKMPEPLGLAGAVLIGDEIWLIGADSGSHKTLIYNGVSDSWSEGPIPNHMTPINTIRIQEKIYSISTAAIESLQVDYPNPLPKKQLYILMNTGESFQLSVSNNLAQNTALTWSSSDESVANVDTNGKVSALQEGLCSITAFDPNGSYSDTIPVKVLSGNADEYRLAVHLQPGETTRLHLSDSVSSVSWKSMDESVATVSGAGIVTAKQKGLVIVSAEDNEEKYHIYVRVNT